MLPPMPPQKPQVEELKLSKPIKLASILTSQLKPLLSYAPLLNYKHSLLNDTPSTNLFPAYLQIYFVLMFCCGGIDFQHQQAFWHHEPTFISLL